MIDATESMDWGAGDHSCSACTSVARSYLRSGKQQHLDLPIHNQRPRPGRRKNIRLSASTPLWTHCWILVFLTVSTLCLQAEAAGRVYGRRSSYGRFVQKEDIHLDQSPPPQLDLRDEEKEILFDHSPPPQLDLFRRDSGGDLFGAKTADIAAATTAIAAMSTAMTRPDFSSPATALASSATGLGSIVAPTGDSTSSAAPSETAIISAGGGDTSQPKAFDGGLGTNYTEPSCPLFLNSFLNNDTFTDCMPFSLLLQVSSVQ